MTADCRALACTLALPLAALILPSAALATSQGSMASGSVTLVSGSSFTIQTPGKASGVVNALTSAATRITSGDYPYVYGGGHAEAGVASIGIKGPGYNGHRVGFDCSGSVAAVLSGAGLWQPGSGVPNDAGIITQLVGEHLIARGVGTGPVEVTLYDNPGVHIFMNIDGRFFGTSDGGGGGDPKGGAGWLSDGAPDASTRAYKPYHLVPSVLKASTTAGHSITFQAGSLGSLAADLEPGEKVQVVYSEASSGSLVATAITFPGALTTTGMVEAISSNGTSFTVQTTGGTTLTLATTWDLIADVQVGDTVQVTYTTAGSTSTAVAVQVTAPAAPTGGAAGPGDPSGGGGYGGGGGITGGGGGY